MQIYLIRHGQVEEGYHKVFGGSRINMGLSPRGVKQGEAVAEWLKDTPLDAMYASPMLRVQQTLAPMAAQRGMQPQILPGLREMDFGDWTGNTWDEIQSKFGMSAFDWLEIIESNRIPNGEDVASLKSRVQECMLKIIHAHPQGKVAVYCHGGIIRVILALLLEVPLAHLAHFNIEYGSISLVELLPERKHAVEIELLNFQPPLK